MIEQINSLSQSWLNWMWPMLWQVAVLITIIAIIDFLIKRWAWPQVRYALWLLVLIKLILPPALVSPTSFTAEIPFLVEKALKARISQPEITLPAYDSAIPPAPVAVPPVESFQSSPQAGIKPLPITKKTEPLKTAPVKTALSWQAYAFIVWLAGIIVLSAWLIVKLAALRREHLKDKQQANLPDRFRDLLEATARKLKLKNVPQVILTGKVSCPAVFGVFRPVLLMPSDKLKNLTTQDTEHILLHELAHIKRGDLFVHAVYI
ncbi:MAG: M56 family metallopeptidase [Planctomycetota bacterium]